MSSGVASSWRVVESLQSRFGVARWEFAGVGSVCRCAAAFSRTAMTCVPNVTKAAATTMTYLLVPSNTFTICLFDSMS
jgi:hypothetical protein